MLEGVVKLEKPSLMKSQRGRGPDLVDLPWLGHCLTTANLICIVFSDKSIRDNHLERQLEEI